MSELPERIWVRKEDCGDVYIAEWSDDPTDDGIQYVRAHIADTAYSAGRKAAMEAAETAIKEMAERMNSGPDKIDGMGEFLLGSAIAALRGMKEARRG